MYDAAVLPKEYRKYIGTDYVEKFTWMLPLLLLLFAAFYVFLTHAITRRLLKKSTSPLPGLPPIHEWRLPKSLVWYFLVVLAIGLFITDKSDFYFQMIVYNLLPLFMVLFVIQARQFDCMPLSILRGGAALFRSLMILAMFFLPIFIWCVC